MISSARGVLRDSISATSPAGDRVLLHIESGTYLRLGGSAGVIVDLLAEHEDPSLVVDELVTRYDLSPPRALNDVNVVVNGLQALRPSRKSRVRRPAAAGVISASREWLRLRSRQKLTVFTVSFAAALTEVGLRFVDVGKLARLMRVPLVAGVGPGPKSPGSSTDALSADEQRAIWATGWVFKRWLFPSTCLRKALVMGFFLRRHDPIMRLGLIDDGSTTHAWVEAEGMTFNAIPVTGTFTR
jgi:hypothetical protein